MKRAMLKSAVFAAATLASAGAMATPCDIVLSDYANGIWPDAPQYHPECFGASQQNAAVSITQTSFAQISAISTALINRFLASPPTEVAGLSTGAAAATPGKPWNIWGNLNDARTRQEYFRPLAGSNIRLSTDSLNTVIGGDYALSSRFVAGVSAAIDRSSGDSYANGLMQNALTNKGYMIAPYVGYSISKELALDASLGFGQGELSQTGNVKADADRWFAGINLNYSRWMGNTQLSGKLGYMHGEEKYDEAKLNGTTLNSTGATNKIDRWHLGAQAAWWMGGAMPYIGLSYLNDHRSTSLSGAADPIGKDAWQWSLGVNFLSVSRGLTGGIVWQQEESRSNQKQHQLVANIGLRF
ncbi:autotransporter outer membrane beta-barrel domain-containing protein [Sulfuricystis multivorans]|uniref:autotransporter outer membrane beta-barrel domain-containing protein n=1 Tax=Sulfuricystis multivorans TaxID=2211108 RepID=UPI000F8260F0|nr:autotransporter outer membrane beta-barrel domain-containing protein [Sulfuricystis multivorans]